MTLHQFERKRAIRRVVAPLAFTLIAAGGIVQPVAAVDPIPTTTTMSIPVPTAPLTTPVIITATVDPIPPSTFGGEVHLLKVLADDSRVFVQMRLIELGHPTVTFEQFPRDLGEVTYVAAYMGYSPYGHQPSESAPGTLTSTPGASFTEIFGPATIEHHSILHLEAGTGSISDDDGTTSFYRVGTAAPLCTGPAPIAEAVYCDVDTSTLSPGTHAFYASYSGTPRVLPSQSANLSVQITPDIAHATGVVVTPSTFYPYADGYLDTVAIRGTRQEPLSVSIKIYRPTGSLTKTISIASGEGAYATSWNGRTSTGTIYPEGKYKIVQTLKDAYSNTKIVTSYVTLSKKKLIWHSGSVVKKGSSISAHGTVGSASVAVNTTSGVLRLQASTYADFAGAGWQFTLPTAVSYKSIAVGVYAKRVVKVGTTARVGSQDFADCAYSSSGTWYESCFDSWKKVGNASGSLAWFSTDVLTSSHRAGTHVRAMVGNYGGTTYVYKARVVFKYATLGY